jgi:hypothetical protein
MAKRKVGSQIANLTFSGWESNWQFDSRPLKSRIALIYSCEGGVPHTVGKILTRATTLL